MTVEEAKRLLPKSLSESSQVWADLGCGSGTFSYALAELLWPKSKIIAIDQIHQNIIKEHNGIAIEFRKANIEDELNIFPNIDGILTANVLHFIKEKRKIIEKFKPVLVENGKWIVIEYEHQKSDIYEPYPIPFEDLKRLFQESGYSKIEKIGERNSVYGGKMYSALISKT